MDRKKKIDRDRIVKALLSLPDEEMLDVLRLVFAERQPAPEEAAFCRNRYFLGAAWSDMVERADHEQPAASGQDPVEWEPWKYEAIAYIDAEHYGEGHLGPDWGFANGGECKSCGFGVRSNVKRGLCPICGSKVYMT